MTRLVGLGNAFALLAFATTTLAGPNRKHRGHKNQCIRQLECWLTIFLVLLALVLAVGYYAYCVYGKTKTKRQGDRAAHARRDADDLGHKLTLSISEASSNP